MALPALFYTRDGPAIQTNLKKRENAICACVCERRPRLRKYNQNHESCNKSVGILQVATDLLQQADIRMHSLSLRQFVDEKSLTALLSVLHSYC